MDARTENGGDKDAMFATIERARGRFAELINAQADEVTYTKNISEGLNMVAAGLNLKAGDNVVVCADLEHPNNVYCWLNLQRHGVKVRMVKAVNNAMPVDEMIARIDERTRCVTASTVSFAPGFRTDVDKLGKACRERGVCFLVDAAQSVAQQRITLNGGRWSPTPDGASPDVGRLCASGAELLRADLDRLCQRFAAPETGGLSRWIIGRTIARIATMAGVSWEP